MNVASKPNPSNCN